jgi:hemerythrin superfamily protein
MNEYEINLPENHKLGFFTSLVEFAAHHWNICSYAKDYEEAEFEAFLFINRYEFNSSTEELVQLYLKHKFRNYRYDKKIIIHATVEMQGEEVIVTPYFLDDKEYDCPEAQQVYDKINSPDFQAQLSSLSPIEKNKKITKFLHGHFFKAEHCTNGYTIEHKNDPQKTTKVFKCTCGCGRTYRTFNLYQIEKAFEKAQSQKISNLYTISSKYIFAKLEKCQNQADFEMYNMYLNLNMAIELLGNRYIPKDSCNDLIIKKAINFAKNVYDYNPAEEQLLQALNNELESTLFNYVCSKIAKYKDQDPNYKRNLVFTLATAFYICDFKMRATWAYISDENL